MGNLLGRGYVVIEHLIRIPRSWDAVVAISGFVNPNVERVEMLIVLVWRGCCNLLALLRTSMIHLYSTEYFSWTLCERDSVKSRQSNKSLASLACHHVTMSPCHV